MGCPAAPSVPPPPFPRWDGPRREGRRAPASGSVVGTVRVAEHPRASPSAVREGDVVLVDGVRSGRAAGGPAPAGPAAPAVRRAGDSVLLVGAREEPGRAAAPALRLSKFHAPEIVFGPDSVQEAAHAAVRLGAAARSS